MTASRARAAIGFSVHTGWAAAIAVGGAPDAPLVIDRRKVQLAEELTFDSAAVYHVAAELPFDQGKALVERTVRATHARARAALDAIARELAERGHEVVAVGLPSGGAALPGLADILRVHARVHAAEGALYRESLVRAAEACGLSITEVSSKDLPARACSALGATPAVLSRRVAAAGKELGPPWTKDQKDSMLRAWMALALSPSGSRSYRKRRPG